MIVIFIVLIVALLFFDHFIVSGGSPDNTSIARVNLELSQMKDFPIDDVKDGSLFIKDDKGYRIDPKICDDQYKYTRDTGYGFKATLDFLKDRLGFVYTYDDESYLVDINCMRCYSTDCYVRINMVSRLLNIDNIADFNTTDIDKQFSSHMSNLTKMEERAMGDPILLELLTKLKGEEWKDKINFLIDQYRSKIPLNNFIEWKEWKEDLTKEFDKKPLHDHISSSVNLLDIYKKLFEESYLEKTIGSMSVLEILKGMISFMRQYYTWCGRLSKDTFPPIIVCRADTGEISNWCGPGKIIRNFVSTTYDLTGNGPEFKMFAGNYLTFMTLPRGLKTFYMVALSSYPVESEILLPFIELDRWVSLNARNITNYRTLSTGYYGDGITEKLIYPIKPTIGPANIAVVTSLKHPPTDSTFFRSRGQTIKYINSSITSSNKPTGGGRLNEGDTISILMLIIFDPKINITSIPSEIRKVSHYLDKKYIESYLDQLINDINRMPSKRKREIKLELSDSYRNRHTGIFG
jgi:hypothetical protein